MNRFAKVLVALAVVAYIAAPASAGLTNLAVWTFETSIPIGPGPHAAEGGLNAGAGSPAKGFHASANAVYDNPVGNGSAESFSSNNWQIGDYYQFCTSTEGYYGIQVNWDQVSSNTGPRDFLLAVSANGKLGPYEDVLSYTVRANVSPAWSSLPENVRLQDRHKVDLSDFAELDDAAEVCVRLVMETTVSANGATVQTGGTNRVDNLVIKGLVIPEPGTIGLLALGALFLRRRR